MTYPAYGYNSYNPYNHHTFRQLLDIATAQTNILSYGYRSLGFEFHALPLIVRAGRPLPKQFQTLCRESFLLADEDAGVLPEPVALLRKLKETLDLASQALSVNRLSDADQHLQSAEEMLARLRQLQGVLVHSMGVYRYTVEKSVKFEERPEVVEERLRAQDAWFASLPPMKSDAWVNSAEIVQQHERVLALI
ncbi:hypothetical protein LTR85_002345 [Meristemomyces frigidus]|nr:hypothetical protein LTR85_002345 [Meristemomyces frigidus]